MHLLITGHTGFKGSWLAMLAKEQGHSISGLSLEPSPGGAFDTAELESIFEKHVICDVRDKAGVAAAFNEIQPDAIIHMAAQPLVIEGYKDPAGTFEVNVAGTLNVLEAARKCEHLKTLLIVTTDKVYKDTGSGNFSEFDPLGGHDPYSASKAMADLLSQSYANLGLHYSIGIARAGNVIGSGDVSADRLIPDILRARKTCNQLTIRFPEAVRPWQHVLDCVNGYMMFIEHMVSDRNYENGPLILNFGPQSSGYKTVRDVIAHSRSLLGNLMVREVPSVLKETSFLTLNSTRARTILGWKDKLDFETAVAWSVADADAEDSLSFEFMQHQVRTFLDYPASNKNMDAN